MRSFILCVTLACGLAWDAPSQEREPAPRPVERTYTFEMRGKTGAGVFEWLSDKTGKPFITKNIPPGTFNFIAKKDRQYTLPEIIDIVNDGLLQTRYVLINRRSSFTVIPADQPIDPAILAYVTRAELTGHGHTEIVATVVKLTTMNAEELAGEVRKQMGPFGKVVALPSMNRLVLQDTVGNLQRIVATIEEADRKDDGGSMRILTIERGSAAAVAEALQRYLAHMNPETSVRIVPTKE
jgi:type II secretory pathway component GspD/PulD (secretin)